MADLEDASATAPDGLEADGKVRLKFAGEKEFPGTFLIKPEQDNLALRNRITRYSELVISGTAGILACATFDAVEPHRGWIIVGILAAIMLGGAVVRWCVFG